MREILFRGKRIDNGEWVKGYLVPITINCYDKGYEIIESDGIEYDELDGYNPLFSSFRVYPETVGQYTGLNDVHGKQIFEGDIIHARCAEDGSLTGGFVNFTNGCFCVCYFGNNPAIDLLKEYEVIGNIHDNPELIGGKEDGQD